MGLQIAKHLLGNVDRLQLEAAGILDVTPLGKHLEHRGPKPPSGRFIPLRHVGVTLPTAIKVVGPQLVRERRTKQSVLLTDDEFQKVTEQWTVLHSSDKHCMGGNAAFAV